MGCLSRHNGFHVFVYDSHFGVVYHVYVVLCISCLSKIVTMSVTCDFVVVIDHNAHATLMLTWFMYCG